MLTTPRLKLNLLAIAASAAVTLSANAEVACDLSAYKAAPGLTAAKDGNSLVLTWSGDVNQEVRLRLTVVSGTPTVEELAVRHAPSAWSVLAKNATPDYQVTTGLRRMSNQQLEPLRGLGVNITQEVLDKYRWDPFWDAPLDLSPPPRGAGASGNPPPAAGLPGTNQPGSSA